MFFVCLFANLGFYGHIYFKKYSFLFTIEFTV